MRRAAILNTHGPHRKTSRSDGALDSPRASNRKDQIQSTRASIGRPTCLPLSVSPALVKFGARHLART